MQDNDTRNEPPADTVNSAPATEAPQPAEAPAVAPEVPNPEGAAAGGVEAELKAHGDPDAERPFARLLTEAQLEEAGIALDPPGAAAA